MKDGEVLKNNKMLKNKEFLNKLLKKNILNQLIKLMMFQKKRKKLDLSSLEKDQKPMSS